MNMQEPPIEVAVTTHFGDTAAGDDENGHFRPIGKVIDFNGKKRYEQDIAARTVDLATTLSYREAAAHVENIERTPSKDTTRDRVISCGRKPTEFVSSHIAGSEAGTVIPDETNCYGQDDDRQYHNVRVTLAEDTETESRSLTTAASSVIPKNSSNGL